MEEFKSVESSNVRWARYFPEEQRLEIDFKNQFTSTYEYLDFGPMDWQAFVEAKSKGEHFARNIRFAKNPDGTLKYPFKRLK